MPRNGDGSSENGPFEDAGKPIAHSIDKASDTVKSHKVADLPEGFHETGAGLPGLNASGGGNAITNQPEIAQTGHGESAESKK